MCAVLSYKSGFPKCPLMKQVLWECVIFSISKHSLLRNNQRNIEEKCLEQTILKTSWNVLKRLEKCLKEKSLKNVLKYLEKRLEKNSLSLLKLLEKNTSYDVTRTLASWLVDSSKSCYVTSKKILCVSRQFPYHVTSICILLHK